MTAGLPSSNGQHIASIPRTSVPGPRHSLSMTMAVQGSAAQGPGPRSTPAQEDPARRAPATGHRSMSYGHRARPAEILMDSSLPPSTVPSVLRSSDAQTSAPLPSHQTASTGRSGSHRLLPAPCVAVPLHEVALAPWMIDTPPPSPRSQERRVQWSEENQMYSPPLTSYGTQSLGSSRYSILERPPDELAEASTAHLLSSSRTTSDPLRRAGYVPSPTNIRRSAGTFSPVETIQMVNADEALAIALAREEGADNQEAILASIGPSQAGASSAHPTGPAAAEASDDDLEYASEESVVGLAPSAPPDPYAPTPVEPLRISRPPRPLPNSSVEAPRPAPPRVPEIIITPETPTPPEAASIAQPGAERESRNSRRASTDTLPPYTSRVPSLLLPPAYDALSTLRASLPPSNLHGPTEASSADETDVPEAPPTQTAAEARDWWREPFPMPPSIRRRRCTCGSRVYRQIVKKRYTRGSLWKRLSRESHARCRTAKPNCTVHCSGCGKAKGLCSIRGCDGSDSRCDMLLCCPQVRALALQSAFDVFDNLESEAFASLDIDTLPSFDAIIRHESARDLVLDVLDAIRRLLDINIAQSSDDERARAASRWVVQTSTLFDAAWALFLPFNRFAATDSTLEHVYLEMLGFLRLLRRSELISQVDTPACAVEFSRTAMEMWLADADFASHLPELVPRPERMDTPLNRLLMELGNARGVMSMQASTTTSQPTRRKLMRLLSAINDLLAEYDMLPA